MLLATLLVLILTSQPHQSTPQECTHLIIGIAKAERDHKQAVAAHAAASSALDAALAARADSATVRVGTGSCTLFCLASVCV